MPLANGFGARTGIDSYANQAESQATRNRLEEHIRNPAVSAHGAGVGNHDHESSGAQGGQLDHVDALTNHNSTNYTHLTATNHTDLTDGGATTLHKHSHLNLDDIGANTHIQIDSHISNTSNPHSVTFAQVVNPDGVMTAATNHAIYIAQSGTPSTPGANLSLTAGAGTGGTVAIGGVGGNLVNAAGDGASANADQDGGNGGNHTSKAGMGGYSSAAHLAGNGGDYRAAAGQGGYGSPTQDPGDGGIVYINGGNAGSQNGGVGSANGGNVYINGGTKVGTGVEGTVYICRDSGELDFGHVGGQTLGHGTVWIAGADGNLYADGNCKFGDGIPHTIHLDGEIINNVILQREAFAQIYVYESTTLNANGGNLSIFAGKANGIGTPGFLQLEAGHNSVPAAGTGGQILIGPVHASDVVIGNPANPPTIQIYTSTMTVGGTIQVTPLTASMPVLTDASKNLISGNIDHATQLTNINSINYTHLTAANHTDLTDGGSTTLHKHSHTGLDDIGTNSHATIDTFIASKAQASGLASLDGSSKVVQDPASASTSAGAGVIPKADGSGYIAVTGIGIGIAPLKSIHVKANSAYGMVRLSPTADNGEASMSFSQDAAGTDTNDMWVIGQGGWGNTGLFVIGNENNGAGGNARLLVTKAGDVGIGVTPSYGFDADGKTARLGETTFDAAGNIEVNATGSGNRSASIDLHGDDTNTDYALRIIRNNTGVNATSQVLHKGTGALRIEAEDNSQIVLSVWGTDAVFVNSTPALGIGAAPTYTLDVQADLSTFAARIFNDGNDANRQGLVIRCGQDTPSVNPSATFITFQEGDEFATGAIQADNTGVVALVDTSDEHRKLNIKPTSINATEIIQSLRPIEYNKFKVKPDGELYIYEKTDAGFSAQNCLDIYPPMVSQIGKSLATNDVKLIPVLVRALQEAFNRIEILEKRLLVGR